MGLIPVANRPAKLRMMIKPETLIEESVSMSRQDIDIPKAFYVLDILATVVGLFCLMALF